MVKSTGGWVTLGPNLEVFPLEQTRHVGVAKSEHPRLTNGEIIFEEFEPMWSQSTNVTDRRTDGRTDRHTDRQTACDRNTALCTKVHRAVKTEHDQHLACCYSYRETSECVNYNRKWLRLGNKYFLTNTSTRPYCIHKYGSSTSTSTQYNKTVNQTQYANKLHKGFSLAVSIGRPYRLTDELQTISGMI